MTSSYHFGVDSFQEILFNGEAHFHKRSPPLQMVVTITNENVRRFTKLSADTGTEAYSRLNKKVRKVGILDREYRYYFLLTSSEVVGFLFFLLMFILSSNPPVVLVSSLGIAYFSVRIGGLIHDAGHRAIFKSSMINDIYGYLLSTAIAFPYWVWKTQHNLHHSNPNEEGTDPDIEVPISFTEKMYRRKTLMVRIIRHHQAFMFFPFGIFVSFTMRMKAFLYFLKHPSKKTHTLLLMHALMIFIWYIGPFIVFPFWKAAVFFLASNILGGFYMLNVFAPNHKGMPQIEKGTRISFFEKQVITARNISCNAFMRYLYMGLNYQIEHHLFPTCPRNKLHKISPFVKHICSNYGLAYAQMSTIDSSKYILKNLNGASKEFSEENV